MAHGSDSTPLLPRAYTITHTQVHPFPGSHPNQRTAKPDGGGGGDSDDSNAVVAAVVVMACNRADYLDRAMRSLTRVHRVRAAAGGSIQRRDTQCPPRAHPAFQPGPRASRSPPATRAHGMFTHPYPPIPNHTRRATRASRCGSPRTGPTGPSARACGRGAKRGSATCST